MRDDGVVAVKEAIRLRERRDTRMRVFQYVLTVIAVAIVVFSAVNMRVLIAAQEREQAGVDELVDRVARRNAVLSDCARRETYIKVLVELERREVFPPGEPLVLPCTDDERERADLQPMEGD